MYQSKVLRRSRSHRMIGGVVGGLADFLGLDHTLARILYVIISVATAFSGVLAYIICWLVIPEE
ncbi:MAG: PspC domain-containing protein [Planctomycetota bacterium]